MIVSPSAISLRRLNIALFKKPPCDAVTSFIVTDFFLLLVFFLDRSREVALIFCNCRFNMSLVNVNVCRSAKLSLLRLSSPLLLEKSCQCSDDDVDDGNGSGSDEEKEGSGGGGGCGGSGGSGGIEIPSDGDEFSFDAVVVVVILFSLSWSSSIFFPFTISCVEIGSRTSSLSILPYLDKRGEYSSSVGIIIISSLPSLIGKR
jgi:hypothetical protein